MIMCSANDTSGENIGGSEPEPGVPVASVSDEAQADTNTGCKAPARDPHDLTPYLAFGDLHLRFHQVHRRNRGGRRCPRRHRRRREPPLASPAAAPKSSRNLASVPNIRPPAAT